MRNVCACVRMYTRTRTRAFSLKRKEYKYIYKYIYYIPKEKLYSYHTRVCAREKGYALHFE